MTVNELKMPALSFPLPDLSDMDMNKPNNGYSTNSKQAEYSINHFMKGKINAGIIEATLELHDKLHAVTECPCSYCNGHKEYVPRTKDSGAPCAVLLAAQILNQAIKELKDPKRSFRIINCFPEFKKQDQLELLKEAVQLLNMLQCNKDLPSGYPLNYLRRGSRVIYLKIKDEDRRELMVIKSINFLC